MYEGRARINLPAIDHITAAFNGVEHLDPDFLARTIELLTPHASSGITGEALSRILSIAIFGIRMNKTPEQNIKILGTHLVAVVMLLVIPSDHVTTFWIVEDVRRFLSDEDENAP